MPVRITKSFVENLLPGAGDLFWDADLHGFGVRLNRNGTRSYLVQYRLGGRGAATRRVVIGRHGSPWTTTEARAEARRLLARVAMGEDPAAERRAAQAPEPEPLTFDRVADLFVALCLKPEWPRTWREAERLLARVFRPALGPMPIAGLGRRHIHAVLDALADRPARRKYAHAVIRRMCNWLVDRGDLAASPLAGTRAPRAVPPRQRVLAPAEVRALWQASAGLGFPFGPFARLALLTAQRRTEVLGMRWEELSDLDGPRPCWVIPGERMTMGRVQALPLVPAAAAVLRALPRQGEGFVLSTTGLTPVSGLSKAKRRLEALAAARLGRPIPDWRWHDFRRTAATAMQACGIPVEVTERVLGHRSGTVSGVAAFYNLHDYEAEVAEALEAWAASIAWLDACPDPADVPDRWREVWQQARG